MLNKKYEVMISVLTIMTVIVTAVGVSFSYFISDISGIDGEVSGVTERIGSVTFNGGSDFAASDIEPGWEGTKTFSITVPPSDRSTTVYIKLDYKNGFTDINKVTVTSETPDAGILGTGEFSLNTNSKNATQETLSNFNSDTITLIQKTFAPSESSVQINYTLSMEFPNNPDAHQNYDQAQILDATLYAELEDLYYTNGFPNGIPIKPLGPNGASS